jgi:hypothetical protein
MVYHILQQASLTYILWKQKMVVFVKIELLEENSRFDLLNRNIQCLRIEVDK